ncbi:MAG TPA: hypothetical protein VLM36_05070 [Sphingomicrobium sp.]|nr:hypothetical protein [Sphingomicrobium sp.]
MKLIAKIIAAFVVALPTTMHAQMPQPAGRANPDAGGGTGAEASHVTDLTAFELSQPPDSTPAPERTETQATAKKKWEFATIGDVFLAGAHGKTAPRDPLPPVDLDLSFGDVLKAFKFAFMGAAEARNDCLVFLGGLMWVHLGESQGLQVRDVSFADVKIDAKTNAITGLGVGGFGIGSKLTWQGIASANYQFNHKMTSQRAVQNAKSIKQLNARSLRLS